MICPWCKKKNQPIKKMGGFICSKCRRITVYGNAESETTSETNSAIQEGKRKGTDETGTTETN